ncbi:MAG: hypothetical protein AB7W16_21990 [Candidatus Obscuribacterales bacterium]
MKNLSFNSVWMSIVLGILIATAPAWVDKTPEAGYDAPWVFHGSPR